MASHESLNTSVRHPQVHLRSSARSRVWFVKHVLFGGGFPFSEYLLECPSPEVRLVFSKMVVAVAHCTRGDPLLPGVPLTHNTPATGTWSDNSSLSCRMA